MRNNVSVFFRYFAFCDEVSATLGNSFGHYALFVGSTLLDVDNWDVNDYVGEQKSLIVLVPLVENGYLPIHLGIRKF